MKIQLSLLFSFVCLLSFGQYQTPFADCFESGTKALCFHEYFYTGNYPYVDSTSTYEPENGYCWILQVGNAELTPEKYFTVSPNPVQDILQLEFTDENHFVEIYSSTGELMDQFNSNGFSIIGDVSEFETGVYFIKVNNLVQRIVKY